MVVERAIPREVEFCLVSSILAAPLLDVHPSRDKTGVPFVILLMNNAKPSLSHE